MGLYNPREPVDTDPAPTRTEILKLIRGYSQIIPVASESDRFKVVSDASIQKSGIPVFVYRADLDDIEYTPDGFTWRSLRRPPRGRLVKTDGFQEVSAGGAINMALDWAQSGMSFNPANGGGLYIPEAGIYRVEWTGYFSGDAGRCVIQAQRWRSSQAASLGFASTPKPDGADYTAARSELVPLAVGDYITLHATAPSNVWGDSNKNGTSLNISRVG